MKWWKCFLLFWIIMLFHSMAIIIFIKGFLLNRTELPHISSCSDVSQSPCSISLHDSRLNLNESGSFSQKENQRCWTKPAINRVVIIVLDALRFDFVAPSTFFKESKPWMNKLPVIQKWASNEGSMTRIFKAIADPPTTSLQRLKGLTTGGLPTFIDVGDSFGAPAIIEDNFIQQLVQNGKRVVMMGDDTWTQLFPHHFTKSYPYPSFNVKDLHTVDDGCTEHLIPTLYEEYWDVLIAHFLGVDHAGHIFGVNSIPMIEKLDQYNLILENVIEVLDGQSGPGGLHENTLLLVMGDHGQTLNGDHGGGSPEEVETSLFAMNFKMVPSSIPLEFDVASCKLDSDGKKICISSIQQLDFAVTISALLGIPFPFGSIGRVNADLYAFGASTLDFKGLTPKNKTIQPGLGEWMQNYVDVLCVNSWQVMRYIDIYSASSLIGFSTEDISHIASIYSEAQENWSQTRELLQHKNDPNDSLLHVLQKQIDFYSKFLSSVADLARSKWTEFNLNMMAVGFGLMVASFIFQFLVIKKIKYQSGLSFTSSKDFHISLSLFCVFFVPAVRACSFLSNSYILEEGKVAHFLLATIGILMLRCSIANKGMLSEASLFLFVVTVFRFMIEAGMVKQGSSSLFLKPQSSWAVQITSGFPILIYIANAVPILMLLVLIYLHYRVISCQCCTKIPKFILIGTILNYLLILVQFGSESGIWRLTFGKNLIPQMVYSIGCGQFLLMVFSPSIKYKSIDSRTRLLIHTVSILSALSSITILLTGAQGPLVAFLSIIGGYCIMRLNMIEADPKHGVCLLCVLQWNLLGVSLFFCSGHWCAFDGLRYGAAFIGFDEFALIRQAILLAIDTFGFSHILPIFGLPLIVRLDTVHNSSTSNQSILMHLTFVYLIYGLIMTTTVIAMMLCVTIHRRHLMVWGLFAPKFVFDVMGLLVADFLICFSVFLYCRIVGDEEVGK